MELATSTVGNPIRIIRANAPTEAKRLSAEALAKLIVSVSISNIITLSGTTG